MPHKHLPVTRVRLSATLVFKVKWYQRPWHRDNRDGECDWYHKTLKIKANQPIEMQRDTLLHETLHAVAWSNHTRFNDEEHVVLTFATGLVNLFHFNPKLARILFP